MTAYKAYEKLAEIYDSVMPDDFYKNYYEFVLEVLRRQKCKPKGILEVACGTGKLALQFLNGGYNIEGLDISETMLKIARKKGLKVYRGNMIDFFIPNKYDLVLCVFDSLNYLQEKAEFLQCLNAVKKHMNKNGLFIFDMNSDYKINEVIPDIGTKYFKVGDIESVWLNSHQPDTWICEMIFYEKLESGKYVRFSEKHVEKAYNLNVVKGLLKQANFRLVGRYSDFKLNRINKDSERWFFVCR